MHNAVRQKVLLGSLVLILWLAFSITAYLWLVPIQTNFDFYPRWAGANVMLRGENPYALVFDDAYCASHKLPPFVSEHFLYLATITWILLPLWLLPIKIAVSIWCGLQLLIFMVAPSLMFARLGWRAKPLLLALVVMASAVGNYHSVNVYVLGQFVPFVLACLLLAWWLLLENRSWLAALALLGATIRPEGALLVAVILLDLLLKRRYKVVAIWAGLIGTVFLLTVLQIGFWIPDFFNGVEFYKERGISSYPTRVFGEGISNFIIAAVVVWGLSLLLQMRSLPDETRLLWSMSVLILVTLMVLPQTHDYTLVYTLLPIWFMLWVGRNTMWNAPLLLCILATSWLVIAADQPHLFELQQLLNPLALGSLLTYHWYRWKNYSLPDVSYMQLQHPDPTGSSLAR